MYICCDYTDIFFFKKNYNRVYQIKLPKTNGPNIKPTLQGNYI